MLVVLLEGCGGQAEALEGDGAHGPPGEARGGAGGGGRDHIGG